MGLKAVAQENFWAGQVIFWSNHSENARLTFQYTSKKKHGTVYLLSNYKVIEILKGFLIIFLGMGIRKGSWLYYTLAVYTRTHESWVLPSMGIKGCDGGWWGLKTLGWNDQVSPGGEKAPRLRTICSPTDPSSKGVIRWNLWLES